MKISLIKQVSEKIYLDASLTHLGGVNALSLPNNFHNYSIVYIEILNVLVVPGKL